MTVYSFFFIVQEHKPLQSAVKIASVGFGVTKLYLFKEVQMFVVQRL